MNQNPISRGLAPLPSKLFVETTTCCNLACAMCLKHAHESTIGNDHMSEETFARLLPVLPTVETLILNGIGEPLLHPKLESFIRQARGVMPQQGKISFQSNGLLLTRDLALKLGDAGLDAICISVDATTPETFQSIRQGGELEGVHRALSLLQGLRAAGEKVPQVGIECVVRRENLRQLPSVVEWSANLGASFAIVTHIMPYDRSQIDEVCYDPNTDRASELFDRWRTIAQERGLSLDHYQVQAWRNNRLRDRSLIDLVGEMVAEARREDIFINLQSLFERNDALIAETGAVFAAARQVAATYDLNLSLPAAVPQHDRACRFIEDGGAFISWNGDVHPCYNLWNRYRCYISGWERAVAPVCFGNIGETPLQKLWQGERWEGFRRNVLAYDYPFCSNCGVAPCDYIESETFEQDCYLREEPCGACLWAMGLLQCLQ